MDGAQNKQHLSKRTGESGSLRAGTFDLALSLNAIFR